MHGTDSEERVDEIIERRLKSPGAQTFIPEVLKDNVVMRVVQHNSNFLAVLFLDEMNQKRIAEFKRRNINPFVGLFTTDSNVPAGMRLEYGKNNYFSGCAVRNSISFSVGRDTTFIFHNHTQRLTGTEIRDIEYTVPLGYVVSYGDEITRENIYEFLENLIVYSIKVWREHSGN